MLNQVCIAAWWRRSRVAKKDQCTSAISNRLMVVSLRVKNVSASCRQGPVSWRCEWVVQLDIGWCVMRFQKSSILYKIKMTIIMYSVQNQKTIFRTKFCQLRRYVHSVKNLQSLSPTLPLLPPSPISLSSSTLSPSSRPNVTMETGMSIFVTGTDFGDVWFIGTYYYSPQVH